MGYMKEHAIIVTSEFGTGLDDAYGKAQAVFGQDHVSPIMGPYVNNHRSFFVPPDGSKEGWAESDKGDEQRGEFKRFLRTLGYEDGSTSVHWCEVVVHDDDGKERVEDCASQPVMDSCLGASCDPKCAW